MKQYRKKPPQQQQTPPSTSDGLLAFVADVHLGNHKAPEGEVVVGGLNSRCHLALKTFSAAIKTARARGATFLVVGGDLVHARRPEPALIAAINRVLEQEAQDIGVLLLPGNHEMLDATARDGNTACEPFYSQATVPRDPEWYPLPGDWAQVFAVPFNGEEHMADYLVRILPSQAKFKAAKKILVTHVGVYDDDTVPWLKAGRDAIHVNTLLTAMELGGFDAAFVGNYHQHQTWKHGNRLVCQVGTLCPATFSDEGVFPNVGGMALYDGDLDMVEIPGPRFAKVDTADSLEEKMTRAAPGSVFFARTESRQVFATIGPHPDLASSELVEVVPADAHPMLPQVSDAGEAIEEYVKAMPLPDGVTAEAVLTEARTYWNQAAGGTHG